MTISHIHSYINIYNSDIFLWETPMLQISVLYFDEKQEPDLCLCGEGSKSVWETLYKHMLICLETSTFVIIF